MKLDRAKHHKTELESAINAFMATKPYGYSVTQFSRDRGFAYTLSKLDPVPSIVPLVAGDVIQCLRSALDHVAYLLYIKGTGGQTIDRGIYFPIGKDLTHYQEKARQLKAKGISPNAVAAIDSIQPYKGGNDILWQLSELNNIDKHRLILTAQSTVESVNFGSKMASYQNAQDEQKIAMGLKKPIQLPPFFIRPKPNPIRLVIGEHASYEPHLPFRGGIC